VAISPLSLSVAALATVDPFRLTVGATVYRTALNDTSKQGGHSAALKRGEDR
jgi:hypothetical protein